MRLPLAGPRPVRVFAILGLLLAFLVAAPAGLLAARPPTPVDIQILDISDWHAQLDPNDITGVGRVGGAAYLSTYFKADRAANPTTLTVTAGDAYGASPPLSGFFDEVPGVLGQRMMGIDVDTFGNHNFDRGIDHLQEMVDLAGSPTSAEQPGEPFGYVSANLRNRDANLEGVKDFEIFMVGGIKVAVIGITNPEAPTLVFPGSMGTIEVTDPVPAANRARAAARAAGAKVFIAITHLGVTGFDAAGNPTGPVIDFANAVGGFHVIFGDHTDVQYSGVVNNALVVENRSKGVSYSKTRLRVQPDTGRVVSRSNAFVTPFSTVTPDPAIQAMLQPYRDELAELFDEKIAVATGRFPRGGNIERRQEVAIGDLIAEAMRSAYGTQFALTNGGGIRSPLPSTYVPQDATLDRTDPPPYDLVVGDPYTVLPFGNVVVTRQVTGSQLWDALEHGVAAVAADGSSTNGRFPQIAGFRFVFDSRLAVGSRVLAVTLPDGTPIADDGTSYSLALPDFVNAGGDGYTMFLDEHGVTRDLMAAVLLEHIRSLGTLSPTVDGRIRNCATAAPPCP